MFKKLLVVIACIAAAVFVGAMTVEAGTVNMGGGISCVGLAPTYGTNPRIACVRTASDSRYAYRWYQAPIGGGQCRHWAQYGSAYVWSNGTRSFYTSSQTYLYQGSCF